MTSEFLDQYLDSKLGGGGTKPQGSVTEQQLHDAGARFTAGFAYLGSEVYERMPDGTYNPSRYTAPPNITVNTPRPLNEAKGQYTTAELQEMGGTIQGGLMLVPAGDGRINRYVRNDYDPNRWDFSTNYASSGAGSDSTVGKHYSRAAGGLLIDDDSQAVAGKYENDRFIPAPGYRVVNGVLIAPGETPPGQTAPSGGGTNQAQGAGGDTATPPPKEPSQASQQWSTLRGQRVEGPLDFSENDPAYPSIPEASANAGATSNTMYWQGQPRIPQPGEDDTTPGFYNTPESTGNTAGPGTVAWERDYMNRLSRGVYDDSTRSSTRDRRALDPIRDANAIAAAKAAMDVSQQIRAGSYTYNGMRLGPNGSVMPMAKGGSMMVNDPIAFVNLRTKRPFAVAGEAGRERIDVTPMAEGGTIYSQPMPYVDWKVSADNDADSFDDYTRWRNTQTSQAPSPAPSVPPATDFTNNAPPPPPRVPEASTPPIPAPAPVPVPGAPPPMPAIDPMQDAIRRRWEQRQRAKMAYRYGMAGLPNPYGVSLSELPPGLFWEDDLAATLPPDHPSNQPPPGTTPPPGTQPPPTNQIPAGIMPYVDWKQNTPNDIDSYDNYQRWASQQTRQQASTQPSTDSMLRDLVSYLNGSSPNPPAVGEQPLPNDPLAFLAAKLFGDRRAA